VRRAGYRAWQPAETAVRAGDHWWRHRRAFLVSGHYHGNNARWWRHQRSPAVIAARGLPSALACATRSARFKVWCGLEQSTVDMVIDRWRKRLRACVSAKGRHFEHSLWTYWLFWFCQIFVAFFVMFYLNFASLSKTALLQRFTFTLLFVLQGNVTTKLSYGGKLLIFVISH